jgi:hypothetical protein
MTTTDVRGAEIADYLGAVRAALVDLDPVTRDGLLEDLPEHLAEVAAADPEPLPARLGPPVIFAAELRSAAGLAAPATTPMRPEDPSVSTIDLVRSMLTITDRGIGRRLGYDRLWSLITELQPAWWIVRGIVVFWAILAVVDSYLVATLCTVIVVGLSIRLGRTAKIATTGAPKIASTLVSVICIAPLMFGLFVIIAY